MAPEARLRQFLIDAGNTRIKWGLRAGDEWLARGALPTADVAELRDAFLRAEPVERVVGSNVAGKTVQASIREALGVEPRWVSACREQCGVRSSYAHPAQLGADRWAALIGARQLVAGSCVIANAGTTMTVDALSADAIFLGGFIVAGYDLMRETLARNTAQLKIQDGSFSFFPDNTGDAIASGAINALVGAVERMVSHMRTTSEDEPVVLLSGGGASRLLPHLTADVRVVENLVLEGLARIGQSDG
jgi:type III pantothenate kinase